MRSKISLILGVIAVFLIYIFIFRDISDTYEIVNYRLIDTIDQVPLSEIYWLYSPAAISEINDELTFIDRHNSRILFCDKEFQNCISIGRSGKGPGEFMNPGYMNIRNNQIFVSDCANNRIEVFNSHGEYLTSINVKTRLLHILNFSLSNDGNYIYIPATDGEFLYYRQNLDGTSFEGFGVPLDLAEDKMQNSVENAVLLATDERNNVYTVFYGLPIIRKYDFVGNVLWENDLSYFDALEQRYIQIEESRRTDKNNRHAFMNLFIYSLYYKEILYVVYVTPDVEYWSKRILGIDANNGNVKLLIDTHQDDYLPSSLCFTNNRIYATEGFYDKILVFEKTDSDSK